MSEPLSQVEQRLLQELLSFHAARLENRPSAKHVGESQAWTGFEQPRRRSHWVQNLVVFAALLAVSVFAILRIAGVGSGPALAATPPPLHYMAPGPGAPSGRAIILRLAKTAARQPLPPTASGGSYAYVKTVGWYLDSAIGGGTVTSQVVPQVSQSWLRPNGSGRQVNVTGGRVDDFTVRSGPSLFVLSTNPTVLARQLAVGHPASNGPAEKLVAFTDTARQQPIPPPAEAAILRLLARIPGLINSGTVIDRAGRPGIAISLDSAYSGAPTRYTLIFDPHTGKLLGEDDTVIRTAPALHLRPGSVISYFMITKTGYVSNTTSTP
ncbi:MAG: CU044_5270 family protein [Solirubrobacteraceae bacterium]